MDQLAKLFGSPARLKLLRLFLFNENAAYSVADAAVRTKITKDAARKDLSVLLAAGIIRRKGSGYGADKRFAYFDALASFVRRTTEVGNAEILALLRKAGTLRLVVTSGLFVGAEESQVDLLIVGDKLDERVLKHVVHGIEAELGREIRYASFSTEDFRYRLGVYDRLVRDVLDYPHATIFDKVGLK
jgi:DNA-binding transcriptional ArsR family regulator